MDEIVIFCFGIIAGVVLLWIVLLCRGARISRRYTAWPTEAREMPKSGPTSPGSSSHSRLPANEGKDQ